MNPANPLIAIVDDDASFRRSTARLVRSAGHKVQIFGSAGDFLKSHQCAATSCIILDVRMPGIGGLELQKELAKATIQIPIVFVTGHGDIPMSVQAIKAGAIEFLTKPFREQDLLDSIQQALQRDRALRRENARLQELRARYQSLTRRQRQVLSLVVAGKLNKQIAADLQTVEKTIKFHRARVMRKMGVASLAELVRAAAALNI